MVWSALWLTITAAFIIRVLHRAHRDPAARAAWIMIIVTLPALGAIAYLLLGETSIGRTRLARLKRIQDILAGVPAALEDISLGTDLKIPEKYLQVFNV